MVCCGSRPSAPEISMSYQSTEAEKPCNRSDGCHTKPNVVVSACSGFTLGLPPVKLVAPLTCTLLLSGSRTLAPPAVASKRSRMLAARTSRDCVALKRSESSICQLKPYFQDEIAPEPV